MPCYVISRPYTCKGMPRDASQPGVLRIKTNAPVIELSGVIPDPSYAVLTLIVDGQLVPPKVLSASRVNGAYAGGTILIDFGTSAPRDIWIDMFFYLAFVKIDAADTLSPVDDATEPQISVIGDSYLQTRSAAFSNGGAIAYELAARLGLRQVITDSIGGTGYYNSGLDQGNLNDRLAAHGGDNSIVYLVMAGLNDYSDLTGNPTQRVWPTRSTYEQAVNGYLQNLRAAQPKALIAVTAPFCPIPPQSDSTYVSHTQTNNSGLGDFLYVASVHKAALQQIAGPWVYIDVLMGGGWLNSSGKTGDITGLQWFTGGTPGPNTSATNKPGNTTGGGGGGFNGIKSVPIVSGGAYSQAPEITATGGSGRGALLASRRDPVTGALTEILIVQSGSDYDIALPTLNIDPTYQITPAVLGTPVLTQGVNANGQYPLLEFAPIGTTSSQLNNVYRMLSEDLTHPSCVGVEYLSKRLAQNLYESIMNL